MIIPINLGEGRPRLRNCQGRRINAIGCLKILLINYTHPGLKNNTINAGYVRNLYPINTKHHKAFLSIQIFFIHEHQSGRRKDVEKDNNPKPMKNSYKSFPLALLNLHKQTKTCYCLSKVKPCYLYH